MPYSKCPICGQQFHLTVTKNIDSWYAKYAPGKKADDDIGRPCFGCWKELKDFDVVEVISKSDKLTDKVSVGDIGTVVMVHEAENGSKEYEVECVLLNGTNRWRHTFERRHLRYSADKNRKTAE